MDEQPEPQETWEERLLKLSHEAELIGEPMPLWQALGFPSIQAAAESSMFRDCLHFEPVSNLADLFGPAEYERNPNRRGMDAH